MELTKVFQNRYGEINNIHYENGEYYLSIDPLINISFLKINISFLKFSKERYFIHYVLVTNLEKFFIFDNFGQHYGYSLRKFNPGTSAKGFEIKEDSYTYQYPLSEPLISKVKERRNYGHIIQLLKESKGKEIELRKTVEEDTITLLKKQIENMNKKYKELESFANKVCKENEKLKSIFDAEYYNIGLAYYDFPDEKWSAITLFNNTTKDYTDICVKGSWDNWEKEYKLELSTDNKYWYIQLDFIPKEGTYNYKLKKGGEWIELLEFDIKQKSKDGSWNNVIHIHHPIELYDSDDDV